MGFPPGCLNLQHLGPRSQAGKARVGLQLLQNALCLLLWGCAARQRLLGNAAKFLPHSLPRAFITENKHSSGKGGVGSGHSLALLVLPGSARCSLACPWQGRGQSWLRVQGCPFWHSCQGCSVSLGVLGCPGHPCAGSFCAREPWGPAEHPQASRIPK